MYSLKTLTASKVQLNLRLAKQLAVADRLERRKQLEGVGEDALLLNIGVLIEEEKKKFRQ